MEYGKKGIFGSIFLDPHQQGKGYGKQAMLMIEKLYPKVIRWKLDTPSESHGLHKFYESLGYIKTGEMDDRGMKGLSTKRLKSNFKESVQHNLCSLWLIG